LSSGASYADGPQSHTYVGAALTDIVPAASPDVDAARKHPLLPFTILAIGADTEDGEELDAPRFVVPGDIEGARYVSQLVELRVVDLAGIAPGGDGVPADGDGYHSSQR
jgi:hypothetical protein